MTTRQKPAGLPVKSPQVHPSNNLVLTIWLTHGIIYVLKQIGESEVRWLNITPIVGWEEYNKTTKQRKVFRRIDRQNLQTGELESITEEQSINYGTTRFLKMSPTYLFGVHIQMTKLSITVLDLIFVRMNRSLNLALISQSDIALELKVSIRQVEKSFSELRTLDVIRKKMAGQWMINPIMVNGCPSSMVPRLAQIYFSLPGPQKEVKQEKEEEAENVT